MKITYEKVGGIAQLEIEVDGKVEVWTFEQEKRTIEVAGDVSRVVMDANLLGHKEVPTKENI